MNTERNRIAYLSSLGTAAPLASATVLSGCSAVGGPTGPDMGPVGAGLKFIGVALVVMALVFVLAFRRC